MNPILEVASRLDWKWQLPSDHLLKALQEKQEIYKGKEVEEALDTVLKPEVSIHVLETVVRLCTEIAGRSSDEDWISQIDFAAGMELYQRFDPVSLQLAVEHFRLARLGAPPNHRFGVALVKEAVTWCKLKELQVGKDPIKELLEVVQLCEQAKERFEEGDPYYAEATMVKGAAWVYLAELGWKSTLSLQTAVSSCVQARELFDKINTKNFDAGVARVHEGLARSRAAEFGLEPIVNLDTAVTLFRDACQCFGPQHPRYSGTLANEGAARVSLADLHQNPILNLKNAIGIFQEVRKTGHLEQPEYKVEFGRSQVNEAVARLKLAQWNVEPVENLHKSVALLQEARKQFPAMGPDYGNALVNEAGVHLAFANLDIDAIAHLEKGVGLCKNARKIFSAGQLPYQRAVTMEGEMRLKLAHLGHAESQLQEAISLFDEAVRSTDRGNPGYGYAMLGKADATRARIEMFPPEKRKSLVSALRGIVGLYQEACRYLPRNHPYRAQAFYGKGLVCMALARSNVHPKENLAEAADLFAWAADLSEPQGSQWTECRRREAAALAELGQRNRAYDRLKDSLHAIEEMRLRLGRDRDRLEFAEQRADSYAAMVKLNLDLLEESTAEESIRWAWEAWHWVHRAKSRGLLDMLGDTQPRLRQEERVLWEEFRQAEAELTNLEAEIAWLRQKISEEQGAVLPFVELDQREKEANLRTLGIKQKELQALFRLKSQQLIESSEEVRTLRTTNVPAPQEVLAHLQFLGGLRRSISEDQTTKTVQARPLLVEFFVLGLDDMAAFLVPLWQDTAPLVVQWKIEHGSLVLLAGSLLKATEGSRQRNQGAVPSAPEPKQHQSAFREALERLSGFIEPWASHLEGLRPTELILSPHSLLNLLPLHAGSWQGKALVEHFPVAYLPSPALAQEIGKRTKPLVGEALLLANAKGDLACAEDEVRYAAKWLTRKGITSLIGVRKEASCSKIISHGPMACLLHLACHTVLEEEDFPQSGVELADQRMTVRDLALLELKNVALVFLSSCESARITLGHLAEFMALARIFFYMGTPSVIASLWVLDDTAASTFTDFFYKSWIAEGKAMAQAFRLAMLATKGLHPDPYHWAPFVMLGDWGPRPSA